MHYFSETYPFKCALCTITIVNAANHRKGADMMSVQLSPFTLSHNRVQLPIIAVQIYTLSS